MAHIIKFRIVVLVAVVFLNSACSSQETTGTWDKLQGLKGAWMSSLDEKYSEHPMIKKFNPEMKPQMMVFKENPTGELMTLSIYNVDGPATGDTTLFVYGTIIPNRSSETKMVEFNVSSSTVFIGEYYLNNDGDIVREFEDVKSNPARKLKEVWRMVGEDRSAFDWYTYTFENGEYKVGDIVVRLTKLDG